jgi:hypothetical protein
MNVNGKVLATPTFEGLLKKYYKPAILLKPSVFSLFFAGLLSSRNRIQITQALSHLIA